MRISPQFDEPGSAGPRPAATPAREALQALVTARALARNWAEPADLAATTRAPWRALLPAAALGFATGAPLAMATLDALSLAQSE